MKFNPADPPQTQAKQCRLWDGLILEYAQSLTDSHNVAISCTIAEQLPIKTVSAFTANDLHLILKPSWLDPSLVQQIQPASLPLNCQLTVADPSLLHLIQLLQAEIHSPKLMSQQFVYSIVTILITHLLRNWQTEQCQH
jgi:hypothetical protein